MNLSKDSRILVEGYIDEVSVNLPKKMRAEITSEIHSLIMDALEETAGQCEIDENTVIRVLRDLGSPVEMAGSYYPHNYVIGPRMYAPFWMSVRWTLIIMTVFYLLGFMISWREAFQSLASLGNALSELVSGYWNAALQTLAIITLVFMILERTIPEGDWVEELKVWRALSTIPFFQGFFRRTKKGDWHPEMIKTIPKLERVRQGETVFELVLLILVVILFNFYPHKVGVYGIINGEHWFVPLLSLAFSSYLPWWNLYWMLAIGLNFTLLARGHWTRTTRWVELGLLVYSGVLVYAMLTGPAILGLNPGYLALNSTNAEAIHLTKETLLPILSTLLQVFLIMHLVAKGINGAIKFARILGRPPVLWFKSGDGSSSRTG